MYIKTHHKHKEEIFKLKDVEYILRIKDVYRKWKDYMKEEKNLENNYQVLRVEAKTFIAYYLLENKKVTRKVSLIFFNK
jgi:hypothetical protein